jgi:hypothetical protein
MRSHLVPALLVAVVACGGTGTDQRPPAGTGGAGGAASLPGGWSIRDRTPYPRQGHTAVLDEDGDRMIVFGGSANDTWQLPLSGPQANVWSELVVAGETPRVYPYNGIFGPPDSAVYDPQGKRMILLIAPTPTGASPSTDVDLWELSLSGTPAWHRLVTGGPSPGAEAQSGHLALDRANHRLLVAGGALDQAGVWALSLDATPTWTRLADMPEPNDLTYADASLVLDASRGQLVLFGHYATTDRVWGLSLSTAQWTLLHSEVNAPYTGGVTTLLDAAHDRLVLFAGPYNDGLTFFSLATQTWSTVELDSGPYLGTAGILDASRGRALYFSGQTGTRLTNTTWTLPLDTLAFTPLVPATQEVGIDFQYSVTTWDPTRAAAVAFGSYLPDVAAFTLSHGLATEGWAPLAAGATPQISYAPSIYDPVGRAIVSFGGDGVDTDDVVRLPSSPGATWQKVAVAGGPVAREEHVAVYDAAHRRMVIHGGVGPSSGSSLDVLDDAWALSLDGAPAWTPLSPGGPGARFGHVAVYDPEGQRMIIYGGSNDTVQLSDVWSLSLGGTPVWTPLSPTGAGPGGMESPSAVYDAKGKRMILLDLATEGARVFALDLGPSPAWHRFCWTGITPIGSPDSLPALLVDDGLFVTVSGGAFRFDLTTSYCG